MQNVHRKKKSKKNPYIFGFFCCRVWQCKEGNVENNRQFNSNFKTSNCPAITNCFYILSHCKIYKKEIDNFKFLIGYLLTLKIA